MAKQKQSAAHSPRMNAYPTTAQDRSAACRRDMALELQERDDNRQSEIDDEGVDPEHELRGDGRQHRSGATYPPASKPPDAWEISPS